ncbi:hypothetical protein [Occultella gossypii]|uniref:NUDIX hydrolase n=1 Tax=Occultella gossypii TaxID=2800820 RepID=A0ABS7S9M5_9MICO|nr:hypothetical protein [Occultella gossypii]MBZ2197025.1 hypothetical protein [Occultella gossypii]
MSTVLAVGLAIGHTGAQPKSPYSVADTDIHLLGEPQWQVWVLAGGPRPQDRSWSRADLAREAAAHGVAGFDAAYEDLLARRLLVETDPAGTWARTVRFHPLLNGLGKLDADGTEYGLGLLGETPLVHLDRDAYDAWQWLPFTPTVGAAAETLKLASGPDGWAAVAERVSGLLAMDVGYLISVPGTTGEQRGSPG